MLRVPVRELHAGAVATDGVLAPDDPLFAGLELHLAAPVEVSGTLAEAAGGSYRWRGELATRAVVECRRCLAPVEVAVHAPVDLMFSADPDLLEDPSVYDLPADAVAVDVTPAVREELVLQVPAFPLCRPDCKGLCPACGADLNAGPCECADAGTTR